jgi:hypothetical protein
MGFANLLLICISHWVTRAGHDSIFLFNGHPTGASSPRSSVRKRSFDLASPSAICSSMTAPYLLREASKSSVTFLSVTCLRCWAVHFTVLSLSLLVISFKLPGALAVRRNDRKIQRGTISKPVSGSKLEGVPVAGRVHRLISYSITSSSNSASFY